MKTCTYICFMLLSSLLLINFYNSISLKKNSSSNKKDDNNNNQNDIKKLDPNDPQDRQKIHDHFQKISNDEKTAVLPGCVRFFAECKYGGLPILTLCGRSYEIPKLAVEAATPSIKDIKSFKIANEVKLTISYTYGIVLQKPMEFFDSVECLPNLINKEIIKKFEMKVLEVDDYSLQYLPLS